MRFSFKDRLKELREEKGLSQRQLARELEISSINISRWEKGEQDITSANLIKIAEYFGVDLDWLTGRKN